MSETNWLDVAVLTYPCSRCGARPQEPCRTGSGRRAERVHDARRDEALSHCTHTPAPPGYLAWFEWAREMAKTHRQERCPGCGLWKVWTPRTASTTTGRRDG